MYLVDRAMKNEDGHNIVQSLIKSARDIETNINSIILNDEDAKANKESIYEKLEILENIDVSDPLTNHLNAIIIHTDTHALNDILEEIIKVHNYHPSVRQFKYQHFCYTKIAFNKEKLNLHLVIHPNNSRHELKSKDVRLM